MIYKTQYESPVGILTLASDGESLVGLWNEQQKYHGDLIHNDMTENDGLQIFADSKSWLECYFEGKNPSIDKLRLAPVGGEFRQSVWQILCEIPYGELITYGDIAKRIAKKVGKEKFSAQAVGGAVGHNPISIIIPCHRVVGANGNLTGYAGGLSLKIKLLELEGVDTAKLSIPKKGTAL